MNGASPADVTQLLRAWSGDGNDAFHRLTLLVVDELRKTPTVW
jgi:hypothetical protein